jgi:hypothetical protein
MQNTKKYLQKIKSFLNYKAPFNCGWNENGLGCKKQCIDCKLKIKEIELLEDKLKFYKTEL